LKGLEGKFYKERPWTLDLPRSKRRKLRGDFIAFHSILRRRSGEGGAELLSLESSDRMHRNGSKLC